MPTSLQTRPLDGSGTGCVQSTSRRARGRRALSVGCPRSWARPESCVAKLAQDTGRGDGQGDVDKGMGQPRAPRGQSSLPRPFIRRATQYTPMSLSPPRGTAPRVRAEGAWHGKKAEVLATAYPPDGHAGGGVDRQKGGVGLHFAGKGPLRHPHICTRHGSQLSCTRPRRGTTHTSPFPACESVSTGSQRGGWGGSGCGHHAVDRPPAWKGSLGIVTAPADPPRRLTAHGSHSRDDGHRHVEAMITQRVLCAEAGGATPANVRVWRGARRGRPLPSPPPWWSAPPPPPAPLYVCPLGRRRALFNPRRGPRVGHCCRRRAASHPALLHRRVPSGGGGVEGMLGRAAGPPGLVVGREGSPAADRRA